MVVSDADFLTLKNQVIGLDTELGSDPSGGYSTVKQRVDALDTQVTSLVGTNSVPLAGDLSGTSSTAKVIGIQGKPVSANVPTTGQTLTYNGTVWIPTTGGGGSFTAAGDLSGSSSTQTVIRLQGRALDSTAPNTGDVIKWTGTSWAPGTVTAGSVTLAGDVTGLSSTTVVGKLNGSTVPAGGSLTAGQLLQVTGASSLGYAALNLASSSVTGVLAATNLPDSSVSTKGIVQLAGDLGGSSTSVVVNKINTATVPVAGALVTGNSLQVSGASSLSYGALNLAGGTNYVTGILPAANHPDATTTLKGIVQLAGDLAGTNTAIVVQKINGAAVSAAGSLVTGNGLYVNGASSLGYSALNLAGGINYVSGILPVANLPDASTTVKGVVQLAGDLAGTNTAVTVAKINSATVPAAGALTVGNILGVTGTSALAYSALNLAGGTGYVTGILPALNHPDATTGAKGIIQLAGDIAGTNTAVTVAKINGSTVPAGGALVTGTVLRVTGVSALAYGALDLANTSAVTGILASANLFQATTSVSGAVKLANNLGGTAALPTVVGTLSGLLDVRSQKFAMENLANVNTRTETTFNYFSSTSNTPATAFSITLNASQAAVITCVATATDGYTGFGGTNRVTHLIKSGKFYRGASGNTVRSGNATDQYIQPNFGDTTLLLLDFTIATNTINITVTGQSTFNAKWSTETTVRIVEI